MAGQNSPIYRLFEYTIFPASFKATRDKTCPILERYFHGFNSPQYFPVLRSTVIWEDIRGKNAS